MPLMQRILLEYHNFAMTEKFILGLIKLILESHKYAGLEMLSRHYFDLSCLNHNSLKKAVSNLLISDRKNHQLFS